MFKLQKRALPSLLACTALLGALALTGTSLAADKKSGTIGAIYLDTQGFYAGVRAGVRDAADQSGIPFKMIETNAQADVSKESAFIDSLVSAKVDAIILSAVSSDGSVRAIRRAAKAGIPVVCYNTCVNDKALQENVYAYAVGDPFKFGEKLGDAAAEYFIKAGIKAPKIAVVNCEFVEVCVQRRKGFEKGLFGKLPDGKIVANQQGTVIDEAITVSEKILSAHPDIDAFFGESGGATLGAVKAVKNQNRVGKIVVFGSDMTTEIAQELIDNTVLKGEVDVSGKIIGKVAFDQAFAAMNGKKAANKLVPVNIDLYTTPEQGRQWLEQHKNGLP